MRKSLLFSYKIPTCWHSVLQWDTLNSNAPVFEYHSISGSINRMELYFITEIMGKEIYLSLQYRA